MQQQSYTQNAHAAAHIRVATPNVKQRSPARSEGGAGGRVGGSEAMPVAEAREARRPRREARADGRGWRVEREEGMRSEEGWGGDE